jgi:acetylornithine/succinyldiaminopimelate/putrescine aminotransferase
MADARSSIADILHKGWDEYREFVNPMVAQRAALASEPVRLVRAHEGMLFDESGSAIEDFHGTYAFGHRHPHVREAIRAYLDSDAPSWFPARVNPFAGRLARVLSERTGYDNAYIACSGSDAVEASLKLARAATRRPRILSLEGAYHGCSFGSVSLMAEGYLRDRFAPFLEGVSAIPFGDVDALARALAANDVAAVVVEPIQGEGGVRELPAAYVEALCELTRAHGTLLVADEVQTGLGRTGRACLASARWPRRPDVVLLAKHLGGGFAPVSAMLTSRETFLRAYGDDFADGESHNTTLGATSLACVAALAALELLTDDVIARVDRVGARLRSGIESSLGGSALVREIRGSGLMVGVSLHSSDHPWLGFEHFGYDHLAHQSTISPLLCRRLYARGFFCFTCGHDWSVLRLQPRFDVPEATIDAFVAALGDEMRYLEELAR